MLQSAEVETDTYCNQHFKQNKKLTLLNQISFASFENQISYISHRLVYRNTFDFQIFNQSKNQTEYRNYNTDNQQLIRFWILGYIWDNQISLSRKSGTCHHKQREHKRPHHFGKTKQFFHTNHFFSP